MPQDPRIRPTPPHNPRRVEVVGFDGVNLLDLTGPLQVFASANALSPHDPPPYELHVVARQAVVTSSAGLSVLAQPLPTARQAVDTLILPGGQGIHAAASDAALMRWFMRRAAQARRVVSVCTGAFGLAAAGLLQDRRATTHWDAAAELARVCPGARIEADRIYVRDGPVSTSAGVTAGIDLCLALVEEDLGHAPALAVARDLVVYLRRPGGQTQFSTALQQQARSPDFDELHAWMAAHLASDLSVQALADRTHRSMRSFARHYRTATGQTPALAVEALRVEGARQLLEGSALALKTIARRCGFGSEETLRRSFLRHTGVTPGAHRERFARGG